MLEKVTFSHPPNPGDYLPTRPESAKTASLPMDAALPKRACRYRSEALNVPRKPLEQASPHAHSGCLGNLKAHGCSVARVGRVRSLAFLSILNLS